MENKVLITITLIIGGLALLIVGCFIGILFQTQKTAPQLKQAEAISSKVISTIIAVGEVTNISERNVTLVSEKEKLTIFVRENARIISFVYPEVEEGEEGILTGPVRERIEFKDIKVGDNLNVDLKILPDGGLETISVIVLSSFPETNH